MKGILNLLNAFQIVIKSYPNSRLIIAGPIDNLPDEIMKAAKDVWAKITLTGKLSAKETISISIQMVTGIQAAHNCHIIHRDIKPQ